MREMGQQRNREHTQYNEIMRWAVHVARRGKGDVHTIIWWGKPDGRRPLEYLGLMVQYYYTGS
jgi:hypothetical protein